MRQVDQIREKKAATARKLSRMQRIGRLHLEAKKTNLHLRSRPSY